METGPSLLDGVVLDGKYRLAELIGQGGMGAVYRAQHVGTQRPVAIKVLLSRLLSNPEAIERFRREARAAGRLRHPNVVDVTDFGIASVDGRAIAYIAMEHLEGTSLRALLDAQGALPVEVVLDIVEQIASALEVAHAAGIVHRDLKPDNVWLVHDARGGYAVRVLDFGIALASAEEATAGPEPTPLAAAGCDAPEPALAEAQADSTRFYPAHGDPLAHSGLGGARAMDSDAGRLTTAGAMVGTPHYMSPEQCRGESVHPSSDVYSLGILAWEALAGHRPYQGDVEQVIEQHLHKPPPDLPRGPVAVSAVLARAMAKAAPERLGSARALAGGLRVAAEGPGVILRRSIALYANRLGEMAAVAWRCGRLPAAFSIAWLLFASIWIVLSAGNGQIAPPLLMASVFWSMGCWASVTMFTNATFAIAIERLRTRPLERLDADELAIELRERLSLPGDAGETRTALRLGAFYFRCENSARVGTGDLAFLVGLLERAPMSEIGARCAQLFAASRSPYRRVTGGILGTLLLLPVLEASVFAHLFGLLGPPGTLLAWVLAISLMPINAIALNPIFSSALALLYFRACQARGEDMPMAAVLSSRL